MGTSAVRRPIAPDPIPFIDLESDEEGEEEDVVDAGIAWARADYQATEQARHSAEQQQLVDTLQASVVDAEAREQARAAQYSEDLKKALKNSLEDKGKAPMKVEGKGKATAPVEVSDD